MLNAQILNSIKNYNHQARYDFEDKTHSRMSLIRGLPGLNLIFEIVDKNGTRVEIELNKAQLETLSDKLNRALGKKTY